MTELFELLKVYKDVGVAGLFICLYLITIYYFYKELKDANTRTAQTTERVVVALDKASQAIERSVQGADSVCKSLDINTRQTAEFISFVRGRDMGRSS